MFKKSVKLIPYFECSPNGSGQPQAEECADSGIVSYPTWQFDEEILESLGDDVWKPLYEAQVAAQIARNAEFVAPSQEDSSLSYFEKYKLVPGAYNQGRLGGTKNLEELALFTGCFDALENDKSNVLKNESDTTDDSE